MSCVSIVRGLFVVLCPFLSISVRNVAWCLHVRFVVCARHATDSSNAGFSLTRSGFRLLADEFPLWTIFIPFPRMTCTLEETS